MQANNRNQKGFTIIEVIVTLILVGITAVLAGMWIVSVASGYIFAKQNAENVQRGQLAITRLTKEFTAIRSVDAGATNDTQITYTRADASGIPVTSTVSKIGSELQLNGDILTDGVHTFTLAYCDDNVSAPTCSSTWSPITSKIIVITLKLTGADNIPLTQRMAPRNL